MRDRFLFRNIWERFQWTFQNLFTCDILFVHLCLCMYIGHKTWTFSTFINCAILIKTLGFFFFPRWFPEVQVMFYEGNKRKQVPSNQDPEKLESFFNCAATLMTDNLQQLTLNSLDDYSDLLCQPPVRPITKLYRSFLNFCLLL